MSSSRDTFWLIDDGRPLDALLRNGHRFNSMAAACSERKPNQGLWEVSRREGAGDE